VERSFSRVGFSTGSVDVLGKHSWDAQFASTPEEFKPFASANYSFNGRQKVTVFYSTNAGEVSQTTVSILGKNKFEFVDTQSHFAGVNISDVIYQRTWTRFWSAAGTYSNYWLDRDKAVPGLVDAYGQVASLASSFGVSNMQRTIEVPGNHNGLTAIARFAPIFSYANNGSFSIGAKMSIFAQTAWNLFSSNRLSLTGFAGLGTNNGIVFGGIEVGPENAQGLPSQDLSLLTVNSTLRAQRLMVAQVLFSQPLWTIEQGLGFFPMHFRRINWHTYFEIGRDQNKSTVLSIVPPAFGTEMELEFSVFHTFIARLGVGVVVAPSTPEPARFNVRFRLGH
jgi:hypothetical protein